MNFPTAGQRGVSTTAVELFGKDEGSDLSTSAVEKTSHEDYASSSATHEGVRNPYLQSRVTRKQNPHSQKWIRAKHLKSD